jgi:multidrug efflux pump subunit AcrB
MSPRDAIAEALRLRVRPIFATTLTAIVGTMPLVLVPGPGSALYRGLGIVIVGGMTLNTAFLLLLLPALLRLGERSSVTIAVTDPAAATT